MSDMKLLPGEPVDRWPSPLDPAFSMDVALKQYQDRILRKMAQSLAMPAHHFGPSILYDFDRWFAAAVERNKPAG